MAETATKLAGWEVLAEVTRVEPAFRAIGDMMPGLGATESEVVRWGAAVAGVADLCERTLADAYAKVRGGFEGEDYIVGHSRALYIAAGVLGRALATLPPEEAERVRFSLGWFTQLLEPLAKKAAQMSAEQEEADHD